VLAEARNASRRSSQSLRSHLSWSRSAAGSGGTTNYYSACPSLAPAHNSWLLLRAAEAPETLEGRRGRHTILAAHHTLAW